MSVDLVEGEPPYAYVRGNPVNSTDPSGYQSTENICDQWSWPQKIYCIEAEGGNLAATEEFYRIVVWRNRIERGWYVAADLLDHYLDGTTSPGNPYYIYDRDWLLSTEQDQTAREKLITAFVENFIKPAVEVCHYSTSVQAYLKTENTINPPPGTEVKNSLGEHYLHGYFEAQVYGDGAFTEIGVKFFIDDYYDFKPDRRIEVEHPYFGRIVAPHQWLVNLKEAGWAAEFDLNAIWSEHLIVDNKFRVRRRPNFGSLSIPNLKPPSFPQNLGSPLLVECAECQSN